MMETHPSPSASALVASTTFSRKNHSPKSAKMIVFPAAISLLFMLLMTIDAAKHCYSGQNARYASKQCSTGSSDIAYVCQKFTCLGGKSPFELRTCANQKMGCLAGPTICKFSGGSGQCQRCESENCNI